MRTILSCLFVVMLANPIRADENWPAFRGGGRAGVGHGATLPTTWDQTKNVRWKVEVPGRGWSSPIVWGERVFVTTCISEEKQPEPRKGLYLSDPAGKAAPGEHQWAVLCFDARTGKKLWQQTPFKGKAGKIHIKNTLASETPVSDGHYVCALFGHVGLACYTVEGKEVWTQKLPPRKTRMDWGSAASLALHDDKVILVNDNEEESYLACLDLPTGKELWRQNRPKGTNWVTPFVWKNPQRTEIVTAGSSGVRSYSLEGELLWYLRGMSFISIPTPFSHAGLLYATSGYVADPLSKPLYAIKPGAKGNISLSLGQSSNDYVAWSYSQAGPYHPSPLGYGDYLYVLYDRGFLSCYEARTGKEVYTRKRVGGGSGFTASPWAYHDRIFCLNEDGETFVLQAGKDFKVLGRNKLDEMTLATPALAGGSLFIRTQSKLYCLRAP